MFGSRGEVMLPLADNSRRSMRGESGSGKSSSPSFCLRLRHAAQEQIRRQDGHFQFLSGTICNVETTREDENRVEIKQKKQSRTVSL
jgi:hypothetical protein